MENKFFITGFSGFVSWHFLEYLEVNKIKANVFGLDNEIPNFNFENYKYIKCTFKKIDLLIQSDVQLILSNFKPNYLLHLASYSSVAYSWDFPNESFKNNTNIFLNILEAVRTLKIESRILSIGSSEEYGNISIKNLPLKETSPLNPISPYAVARVSQEMLSKIYYDGYGLDIIMTRSFNHIGNRQKETFVIPSFAKQLVGLKKNNTDPILNVGDISIIRDFIDVRDVVDAYFKLLHQGKSGEIYNVCSGKGMSLENVIKIMCDILNINITTIINNKFIRPNDNKIIIGCNDKLKKDTNWVPKYDLEQSLKEILNSYKI